METENRQTLTPGRELDALVAEKVMGWTNLTSDFWGCPVKDRASMVPIHKYSTSIAAAWEVVEKLSETHRICITKANGKWAMALDDEIIWISDGQETAPYAICLAALKAVGK
jgi:hypothetical protein